MFSSFASDNDITAKNKNNYYNLIIKKKNQPQSEQAYKRITTRKKYNCLEWTFYKARNAMFKRHPIKSSTICFRKM